jgi:hypothetical protein
MKIFRTPVFLLLIAVLLALAAPRVRAQDEVSFDYFYDNLKPYGEWIQVEGYGLCWRPSGVDEEWAPYTDGYWAYTDAGWTWVSYEDFGDIVYHYGRWVRVEDEGWCWVPDHQWGPAWVSWRNNDEYVGWAPLPPEARFEPEVGISVWADDAYDIGPGYYRFCHVRDFGAPVIREVCFPRSRNIVFFRETVNITNISFYSGHAFCGGPRYEFFSTRVSRPIPTLRLVRETNITNININIGDGGRRRGFASIQRGNALLMPAPRIRAVADRNAPVPNIRPARVLTADHVSRGWTGVNPQERNEIRQEVKQQTRGATPQTAHARPIAPTELKPLPAKVITEGPAVTATTRTPGKGKPLGTSVVPGNPAGTNRPAVTTGEAPRKGAAGDHRVVPPETSGVVTRPGVDETVPRVPQNPAVVGKGKTTTPHTPITTVPSTRGADTPVTHVPPTTTSNGKPLKRFNDDDDQPRTAPTRPSGVSPVQPTQPLQPTQPIERVAPPTSGGFKRGAVNTPDRPRSGEAPEINRAPKPDYDQIQRQQAAARQQQQQAAAMQQQAIARQQQQAPAQERNRGDDARERAQAQAQAAQRQAAAVSAARERAVQVQPQRPPQAQPQSVPQRPPSSAPVQDPRDKKDKDKDDKKR